MHTLVLHDIDDEIVAAIEAKAAANGINTEDQILQIISKALLKPASPSKDFVKALMSILTQELMRISSASSNTFNAGQIDQSSMLNSRQLIFRSPQNHGRVALQQIHWPGTAKIAIYTNVPIS